MNYNSNWWIKAGVLLGLTLIGRLLGLSYIASLLVNTLFFTAVLVVGRSGGSLIGVLSPLIAFQLGLLPAALAPMLPFIIVGNVVLVLIYDLMVTKDRLLAIGCAVFVRYTILTSGVKMLSDLPEEIANMLQASELGTSLFGGLLSFVVINLLAKIDNDDLQILDRE
jgi:hypothetical protein